MSERALNHDSVNIPTPRDPGERRELAAALFRRFHTRCFWYCPRDLEITDDLVPFVARGLRAHGGREGFRLAGKLRSGRAPD